MSKQMVKETTRKKKNSKKKTEEPISKCRCREPLYVKFGPPQEVPVSMKSHFSEALAKINDPCGKSGILGDVLKLSTTHKDRDKHSRMETTYSTTSAHEMKSPWESPGSSEHTSHSGEPPEIQKRHYGRSHSSIYGLTFSQPLKIFNFGERRSGTKTKGPPQDFQSLRSYHLENKTLFEDPEFPADATSLYFIDNPDDNFEWKRPKEIVGDPKFFVDGFSRSDIIQGRLGDCWLSAAVDNLTLRPDLFLRVVPDDQCFGEHYVGMFHFRFWHYGRWIDVVVDDRLPTANGQLVYIHSTEPNEFWSPLLEKAYAKLQGCYEALKGGTTSEAMADFTGGLVEIYILKQTPLHELHQLLFKAHERSSLIGSSIEPDPLTVTAKTSEGLLRGHAYSITGVRDITTRTSSSSDIKAFTLIRLRNPWGHQPEWNGAWADQSDEWSTLPLSVREDMSLVFENDGEFWMDLEDFQANFDRLELCNLNPDSLLEKELMNDGKKKWQMSVFEGEWVAGVTAGGCRNHLETFWLNPQYMITLGEVDENDEDSKCTVIIALMQKNRRKNRKNGIRVLNIGFVAYHLYDPEKFPKPLDYNFFKFNNAAAKSPTYLNMREVTCRVKLAPGTYCIVPSTFSPDEEGEFLLRVCSEHANNMTENDQGVKLVHSPNLPREERGEGDENEDTCLKRKTSRMFLEMYGEDEEIGWTELKNILDETMTNIQVEEYSKETCRSMIALLDEDRSGKLCYEEFNYLCLMMIDWKKIFETYNVTRPSALTGYELRQAFEAAGYTINWRILNLLMHRYGNEDHRIEYEDFLVCAIKLNSLIDLHTDNNSGSGMICLDLESFLECALYT